MREINYFVTMVDEHCLSTIKTRSAKWQSKTLNPYPIPS